jgi:hypothetical protein
MTQFPSHKIPQTQDELRDRFVSKGLREKLLASCKCIVEDPFDLGMDHWGTVITVRREEYRDRETDKRTALLYWTKDDPPELIISTLDDGADRYAWNFVLATKPWSSYLEGGGMMGSE